VACRLPDHTRTSDSNQSWLEGSACRFFFSFKGGGFFWIFSMPAFHVPRQPRRDSLKAGTNRPGGSAGTTIPVRRLLGPQTPLAMAGWEGPGCRKAQSGPCCSTATATPRPRPTTPGCLKQSSTAILAAPTSWRVSRAGITQSSTIPGPSARSGWGELDRHLFAEGNHHHILAAAPSSGCHPCERSGVPGVSVRPLAPTARSVWRCSVIQQLGWAHHSGCNNGGAGILGAVHSRACGGQPSTNTKCGSPEGALATRKRPLWFSAWKYGPDGLGVSQLGNFRWSDQAWVEQRGQP